MNTLNIDIETFSSVDLKKAGLYRYVQSPDFQTMLFACSLDHSPVHVFDLAQGDLLPAPVVSALFDPQVIKWAYNAGFEWQSLGRHFGLSMEQLIAWLPQWRCTMIQALYCGFPGSLADAGAAVGLPVNKQKLYQGSALIKIFCTPKKPSRANGYRTRTLPHHEPEKWQIFKSYCGQDVVAEIAVADRLAAFPVPDWIWQQWRLDQISNLRGVTVDMPLTQGALACDETIRTDLMAEAMELSGLDNPNSTKQLIAWLEEELDEEIPDLTKATVAGLLETIQGDRAKRMLELRQELSKTSIKKYAAISNAVGADGRVRGLLQFYGANRTGRWGGRLIQPQNLPRTSLSMLPMARDMVKRQRIANIELIYGSVSYTLSQLIRTALISAPGKVLLSADFSAIEARIIAWLAKETWVMDVFATHGKIYEATAAQMFGVDIDLIKKGNPEYELRQKGKVATLALGYQGSTGALINMGALKMGIPEEDLPDIVQRWRAANPRIVDLWYALEAAAIETTETGRPTTTHGITFNLAGDYRYPEIYFLIVTLPSGRNLFYSRPHMTVNRWDKPSVGYWGVHQEKKKWMPLEIYGGKWAENITQAVARDCLAVSIERLEAAGYQVLFHVHDEIIVEVNKAGAENDLQRICNIMGQPISWAPGLLLTAEGYISEYYKKD